MSAPRKWDDLAPRIISGAAMAAGGLFLVWMGGLWFAALAIVCAGLMVWELAAMTDQARPGEAKRVSPVEIFTIRPPSLIRGASFWLRKKTPLKCTL